jgi:hypothetical protein
VIVEQDADRLREMIALASARMQPTASPRLIRWTGP